MEVILKDKKIEVVIKRKRTNKNTYIRFKEDLKIYVTTNYFTGERNIVKLIKENQEFILKMYDRELQKKENAKMFSYLGKKYAIVYINSDEVVLGEEKILVSKNLDLEKWLLKEAKRIFQEELNKIYTSFPCKIPYPTLTIRHMKTRWGVCNTKTKRVTLNLELIKRDIKYLDYVIAHELSHLKVPNHQKEFWLLVEKVIPNYKELRKEMREYE